MFKRLGYHQTNMLRFIKNQSTFRFSIARDSLSRRVAASLEKRGIFTINRDFDCWVVNITRSQMIAIRRLG